MSPISSDFNAMQFLEASFEFWSLAIITKLATYDGFWIFVQRKLMIYPSACHQIFHQLPHLFLLPLNCLIQMLELLKKLKKDVARPSRLAQLHQSNQNTGSCGFPCLICFV
jgi:hypothetical protein